MAYRILIAVMLLAALCGSLIYSKLRPVPLKVSGFVEADEIRLGSRLGGRVERVLVEEGQRVDAGQPLLLLDEYDFQQRLAEAEANLSARRAEYDKLVAGSRPQEVAQAKAAVDALVAKVKKLVDGPRSEEIAASKAQLQLAVAQLDRAKSGYERLQSLFENRAGTISRDEIDRALEEYKIAQALHEARLEELQLLEKGTRQEDIDVGQAELEQARQALELVELGFRKEDIAQSKAAMDAAAAHLASLQIQHGELNVASSVDGVVSALELRPGDLVAPNSPVLTLLDTKRLWVRAYVPEDRLDIKVGQRFPVTVDSYPDRRFEGEVSFVATQAEFTPRNVQTPEERSKQVFRIKLYLTDTSDELRPGMAADVWLDQPLDEVSGRGATH